MSEKDKDFEKKRDQALSWLAKTWKGLPNYGKMFVYIVGLLILAQVFPWKIFGDMGGYISAGLILGAIYLILRLLGLFQKKEGSQPKKGGSDAREW